MPKLRQGNEWKSSNYRMRRDCIEMSCPFILEPGEAQIKDRVQNDRRTFTHAGVLAVHIPVPTNDAITQEGRVVCFDLQVNYVTGEDWNSGGECSSNQGYSKILALEGLARLRFPNRRGSMARAGLIHAGRYSPLDWHTLTWLWGKPAWSLPWSHDRMLREKRNCELSETLPWNS